MRIPKQKIVGEGRAKQNNDFTVDIFTSRTNEEREKDRIESVSEHQQVEIRRKIEERIEGLKEAVATVLSLSSPIPFDATDNLPVHLLIFLMSKNLSAVCLA